MFNFQGSELIIILLLALVVLGPEKLPDAMRKAGNMYAELKKMSSGFQEEFRSAMSEPVKEMRETANILRDSADFTKLRDGERAPKPHSAEMVAAADTEAVPVDDVPFQPTDADEAADGAPAVDEVAHTGEAPDTDDVAAAERPTPFAASQRWSFGSPATAEPTPETTAGSDVAGAADAATAGGESDVAGGDPGDAEEVRPE